MVDIPIAKAIAQRWRSNLSILAALSFLRGAQNSIYGVIWQPFFLSMGASMPLLGLLNSLGGHNGILPTIMQPIGGWFADRIGNKPFILVSSVTIIGAYLLFAAAGALYAWFLAIGGILLLSISTLARPAISSMTAESVRVERQGTAFSLIMVATTVPGILAPTLGGWAADQLGFVAVFPSIAVFEVLILLLVWRYLRETRSPSSSIQWRAAASAFLRSALPPKKLYAISFAVAGDAFFWGIGWGIPAALGVKLALGDRPVIALIGDGSAMYSFQGLWTAAHYGLAVTFVICNNSSYRILKERVYALGGPSAKADSYVGMDLEQPAIDFVGLAKALGVPGERVDKVKNVKQALGHAWQQKGPFLIDVVTDRKFKPE